MPVNPRILTSTSALLLVAALALPSAAGLVLTGRVVGVTDGDTLTILRQTPEAPERREMAETQAGQLSPLVDLVSPAFWIVLVVGGLTLNVIWRLIGMVAEKLSRRLREGRRRAQEKRSAEANAMAKFLARAPAGRLRLGIFAASLRVLSIIIVLYGAGTMNVFIFFATLSSSTYIKVIAHVNAALGLAAVAFGFWMHKEASLNWDIFREASQLSDQVELARDE